jgi:hypothetical protein
MVEWLIATEAARYRDRRLWARQGYASGRGGPGWEQERVLFASNRWNKDIEDATAFAFLNAAADFHVTLMFSHDLVNDGQSHAVARGALGGEERLTYVRKDLAGYSCSGIRDRDSHPITLLSTPFVGF